MPVRAPDPLAPGSPGWTFPGRPGDFVQTHSRGSWREIRSVYVPECHPPARYDYWNTVPPARITVEDAWRAVGFDFLAAPHVTALHRRGDPWDHDEVYNVCTSAGWFGWRDSTLPVDFHYQGTYRFALDGHKWCGVVSRCGPRAPTLDAFLDAAGVPAGGIPAADVNRYRWWLMCVSIRGYGGWFRLEPEVVHGLSVKPPSGGWV